jgi:hypothetical protein
MRRLKQGPMEQLKKRKCRIKNHRTSQVEQLWRWRYRKNNHVTSKERVRKRKNHRELGNKDKWKLFQQQKKKRYLRYIPYK